MSGAPFSAPGMALRTAAILFAFVIIFTSLLSAAYQVTRPAIEASAREERMKLIDEVLPRAAYDNDLLTDIVVLDPVPALGMNEPVTVYRARKNGQPVALVTEAVAPDGYAGRIRLILALAADGRLSGVRITQHRETPGLGDYIETRKDKNKSRPWITQFNGWSMATRAERDWRVRKDGGQVDYYAGATVTPRAVSKAVYKATAWLSEHRTTLFAGEQP